MPLDQRTLNEMRAGKNRRWEHVGYYVKPDDNCAAVVRSGLNELLRFGGLMLSAGETAFRVRRSMSAAAGAMGFEAFSVQLASRSLIASDERNGETATMVRDVGLASINTERIGALEALA